MCALYCNAGEKKPVIVQYILILDLRNFPAKCSNFFEFKKRVLMSVKDKSNTIFTNWDVRRFYSLRKERFKLKI